MSIDVQQAVPTIYNGWKSESQQVGSRNASQVFCNRLTHTGNCLCVVFTTQYKYTAQTLNFTKALKEYIHGAEYGSAVFTSCCLQPSIALISLSVRGHWGKILQDVEGWECAQICENSCAVKALWCACSPCVWPYFHIFIRYIPILQIWALTRHFSSCSKSRQPVGDGERPAVRLSLRGEKQVLS